MTKFYKEYIAETEEAIKFLEKTPCKHPGVSENKLKSINDYVGKLIQRFKESKD
jgi:hypothetical protein